MSVLRTEKGLV